jgi:hypothetical protein
MTLHPCRTCNDESQCESCPHNEPMDWVDPVGEVALDVLAAVDRAGGDMEGRSLSHQLGPVGLEVDALRNEHLAYLQKRPSGLFVVVSAKGRARLRGAPSSTPTSSGQVELFEAPA